MVAEAQCGGAVAPQTGECDEVVDNRDAALRMLIREPRCTDTAIEALKRVGARSDAGAAYYIRAQRDDRPSDLLRALNELEQVKPSAASRFNRALTLEALGLESAALAAWDEVRATDSGSWAAEARQHRDRIAGELARAAARPMSIESAQRVLEETLLRDWARAPTSANLDRARAAANAIAQRTSDRYEVDVVDAIAHASPERLRLLQQGHLAFADASVADYDYEKRKSVPLYKEAADLLARGGSPLHLLAATKAALAESLADLKHPTGLLEALARDARQFGYRHLLARIDASRGYCFFWQGRYIESLTAYDEAAAGYASTHDDENIAFTHANVAGDLWTIGDAELACREALQGVRLLSSVDEVSKANVIIGEAAHTALALGYGQIALLYQNAAVALVQSKPESAHIRRNRAVALRTRAEIELRLERREKAAADLVEVARLSNEQGDEDIRRLLQARLGEVEGLSLLRLNGRAAAKAFTRALSLTKPGELRTFKASLLARRAAALRRIGDAQGAERDLEDALAELGDEENELLQESGTGSRDPLWSAYFGRFRETYELLIEQLLEEGRSADAFAYAERERAFEPLHLALQRPDVPRDFPAIAESRDVAPLQAHIPPGTFIVEYFVLPDRTYVWLISRTAFQPLTLRARRSDVQRWTAAVQRAVKARDAAALDSALLAPYDGLVAQPLAAIAKLSGGAPARVVFVPDDAIHGLPFAALRNPVTTRYFMEDFIVSIEPSAKLYVLSVMEDAALSASRNRSVLLIGDPAFNDQLTIARPLSRLQHARNEVEQLRTLYAPGATMLVDRDATVPALLGEAPKSAIVHIAAHAIVNEAAPASSLLLLAPSVNDSGAFDARQILNDLKLHETRLVVLSACSSAGGLPVGPEGVAPLVRPLIAKGVPAVIGSLWDVEDATANPLMVSFHRAYRKGSDAASALQYAQRDLLRNKNPGLRSVLAWGPYQVIGYSSSPFAPSH